MLIKLYWVLIVFGGVSYALYTVSHLIFIMMLWRGIMIIPTL